MSDPRELLLPSSGGAERCDGNVSAVVVGGGIAGVSAAAVLAERGVSVTLFEREAYLGGRAGAWTERLPEGAPYEMERGFHAFFRQYYNLRALLERIDPGLEMLVPLDDYPILGPGGQVHTFSGLPRRTPYNVIALTSRTPTIGLRDFLRIHARRAMEMVTFDMDRTYERRDGMSAGEYLDSLRFPPEARRLLFDVFAHSFFNPEHDMSAAELLMMFHFYFTGNPEGLVFDVARAPFSKTIWAPMRRYLEGLGVDIRTETPARSLSRAGDGRWAVTAGAGTVRADGVVLATTVSGLQQLVADSPPLDHHGWRAQTRALALTRPFAVWRLWLDQPVLEGRAPFVGTTGVGPLDNISLFHLFEDESREWASRTGGAVVELHAYAVEEGDDELSLRGPLLDALHEFYPETRGAKVLHERFLLDRDCPAFAPGSHASRPGVETPFDGVTIAGDFVKMPIPSALMERATASGFLAANHLLARAGVRPEPILAVTARGLLAGLPV